MEGAALFFGGESRVLELVQLRGRRAGGNPGGSGSASFLSFQPTSDIWFGPIATNFV